MQLHFQIFQYDLLSQYMVKFYCSSLLHFQKWVIKNQHQVIHYCWLRLNFLWMFLVNSQKKRINYSLHFPPRFISKLKSAFVISFSSTQSTIEDLFFGVVSRFFLWPLRLLYWASSNSVWGLREFKIHCQISCYLNCQFLSAKFHQLTNLKVTSHHHGFLCAYRLALVFHFWL